MNPIFLYTDGKDTWTAPAQPTVAQLQALSHGDLIIFRIEGGVVFEAEPLTGNWEQVQQREK